MTQSSRPSLASIASAYVSVDLNVPCVCVRARGGDRERDERTRGRTRTLSARTHGSRSAAKPTETAVVRGCWVAGGGGVSGCAQKRVDWCESCHALGTRRCQRPRDISALRGRGVEQDGPRGVNFNREDEASRGWCTVGRIAGVLYGLACRNELLMSVGSWTFMCWLVKTIRYSRSFLERSFTRKVE